MLFSCFEEKTNFYRNNLPSNHLSLLISSLRLGIIIELMVISKIFIRTAKFSGLKTESFCTNKGSLNIRKLQGLSVCMHYGFFRSCSWHGRLYPCPNSLQKQFYILSSPKESLTYFLPRKFTLFHTKIFRLTIRRKVQFKSWAIRWVVSSKVKYLLTWTWADEFPIRLYVKNHFLSQSVMRQKTIVIDLNRLLRFPKYPIL